MMDFIPRDGIDYSAEAEQAVIGSMLFEPRCVAEVVTELTPDDFFIERNRDIFSSIRDLFATPKAKIDIVTLLAHMRRSKLFDEDTRDYILSIAGMTPTAANVGEYVRIVKERTQIRAVHQAAEAMALARTPEDVERALETASSAATRQEPDDTISIGQAVWDVMDFLESDKPATCIPTGIKQLDEQIFLQRTWMTVLAGFPGGGKTLLALQMAYNMSKDYKVGYFFFESSKMDMARRLTSHIAAIDYKRISRKTVRKDEFGDLALAYADASERTLDLIQANGYTTSKIRAVSAARHYDVIFVDYIQNVARDDWRWDDTRAIGKISSDLRDMAVQLNASVIVLSQFHRLGNGVERLPTKYDLKQTSQLEQDAAVILLLSKAGLGKFEGHSTEELEELAPADARVSLLQIDKNRNGEEQLWMHLLMRGQFQRFDYWDADAPPIPDEPPLDEPPTQEMIRLPDSYPTPFDGRC